MVDPKNDKPQNGTVSEKQSHVLRNAKIAVVAVGGALAAANECFYKPWAEGVQQEANHRHDNPNKLKKPGYYRQGSWQDPAKDDAAPNKPGQSR